MGYLMLQKQIPPPFKFPLEILRLRQLKLILRNKDAVTHTARGIFNARAALIRTKDNSQGVIFCFREEMVFGPVEIKIHLAGVRV